MNNQEILDKYKDSLAILCGDTSNFNEFFEFETKFRQMPYSNNIVEKSFSKIARRFSMDSLMYSMPCLFYRNNQWYKYNGNHPEEIQINNAVQLSNTELFKLIKRTLFTREKNDIINKFLTRDPEYTLNLEQLNVNKTHLMEFKNLTIDSQTYQEIRIVLEHLLVIDEKYII